MSAGGPVTEKDVEKLREAESIWSPSPGADRESISAHSLGGRLHLTGEVMCPSRCEPATPDICYMEGGWGGGRCVGCAVRMRERECANEIRGWLRSSWRELKIRTDFRQTSARS